MGIAEDPVLVERDDDIATVIFNRPAKLNAMNRAMAQRLSEEMNTIASDPSIKCVLLRGSGKAFCPGADIGEFEAQRASREEAEAFASYFHGALERWSSVHTQSWRSSAGPASAVGFSSRRSAICASRPRARALAFR